MAAWNEHMQSGLAMLIVFKMGSESVVMHQSEDVFVRKWNGVSSKNARACQCDEIRSKISNHLFD